MTLFRRAVPVAAASCLLVVTSIVGSQPARAAAQVDGTFAVTSVGTNNQITTGPDGNMWATLDDATKNVARIAPDGTVTEYDLTGVTLPVGIAAGADGNLWVTFTGGVARFAPSNPTATATFVIAEISDPRIMTAGPDNNLWTASGDKVIKIPPANPAGYTAYGATGVLGARAITSGGDGKLWVADFGGQQVVAVATDGTGTAYPTGGGPQGVAGGPGQQIGFTNQATNPHTVGRITPGSAPQTTPVPGTDPFGMTLGADGAYWVANFLSDDLTRLSSDGTVGSVPGFPANSGPRQLSAGPGGTLWVTLDTSNRIARVTGVSAPTPVPTPTPTPSPTPSPTTPAGAPQTAITKGPGARVVAHKAQHFRKRVSFRFRSSEQGSVFHCKLIKKGRVVPGWKPCSSPRSFTLPKGSYTFMVRAAFRGSTDPTPAQRSVRVVRR